MTDAQGGGAGDAILHVVPSQFAKSLVMQIEADQAPRRSTGAREDAAWARMCAQNAKLFDGPILAVTQLDLDNGTIWCRRDSYRSLALRDESDIDVAILSVTAVLEACDGTGRRHVLLGKRGQMTRSYPGLWELGPAGGLDTPLPERDTLHHANVMAQLKAELAEETGIDARVDDGRTVAVVFDPLAGSYDIVVRAKLGVVIEQLRQVEAGEPWEYDRTRWLAIDDAGDFLTQQRDQIIGPTRTLLEHLIANVW